MAGHRQVISGMSKGEVQWPFRGLDITFTRIHSVLALTVHLPCSGRALQIRRVFGRRIPYIFDNLHWSCASLQHRPNKQASQSWGQQQALMVSSVEIDLVINLYENNLMYSSGANFDPSFSLSQVLDPIPLKFATLSN